MINERKKGRIVIEALLGTFPNGNLLEPQPGALDMALSRDRILSLAEGLSKDTHTTVEVDDIADPDRDRVFRFYLSLPDSVSWMTFNRELDHDARVYLARQSEPPLEYRIMRLSRVAPFWYATWNRVDVAEDTVVPRAIEFPVSMGWHGRSDAIEKYLWEAHGALPLDDSLLLATLNDLIPEWKQTTTHSDAATVFEALFLEVP